MGEYIEDRGRRDRRRIRKAVGKGKVTILENSHFLFRCGTHSAAEGQKEQPLLLSAPSFRVWRTINQLVLMQQGPAGGLAGEVPRTVTSHILRNLLPSAEILMAVGHICLSMCMYTGTRERKCILLSLFHLSHTLLQIPIFSFEYTRKVVSVAVCKSAGRPGSGRKPSLSGIVGVYHGCQISSGEA